jgi:hypothetical protein
MNEPSIPYSINSLHQVGVDAMYEMVVFKFFADPGPLPTSNENRDPVSNCLAVSKNGATNRP